MRREGGKRKALWICFLPPHPWKNFLATLLSVCNVNVSYITVCMVSQRCASSSSNIDYATDFRVQVRRLSFYSFIHAGYSSCFKHALPVILFSVDHLTNQTL